MPEWVVTFGDMMALLFTFFVLLLSMSEIKQDEKYEVLVESIRRQFGHDPTVNGLIPGNFRPRNSALTGIATMGRARRFDIMRGGSRTKAPVGDHPLVRIVRPGSRTAVGTMLVFAGDSAELSEKNKQDLKQEVLLLQGKPQKIEVRGHTSSRPLAPGTPQRDHWELAYERAHNTMNFLVSLGIEPRRIRLTLAADAEPVYLGSDPKELEQNSRVEVFLLDEVVSDLEGTPEQRRERFLEEPGL